MILPLSLLFTPERRSYSFTLSLPGWFPSPLFTVVVLLGILSSLCLSQLWGQLDTAVPDKHRQSRMVTCLSAVEKQMDSEPSRMRSRGTVSQGPVRDGARSLQVPGGFLLLPLLRMWQVGLAPSTTGERLWNEKAKQMMRWLRVLLGQRGLLKQYHLDPASRPPLLTGEGGWF